MTTPKKCICGSGEISSALYDARGIYVSRVCQKCIAKVKAHYRPDIFTDSNYHTDEPVEEEG